VGVTLENFSLNMPLWNKPAFLDAVSKRSFLSPLSWLLKSDAVLKIDSEGEKYTFFLDTNGNIYFLTFS